MLSSLTPSRSLNRPSPPPRGESRAVVEPDLRLQDSFVRSEDSEFCWKAALLAGVSLFGLASHAGPPPTPAEPIVQMIAWPQGDFVDSGLSGVSLQQTTASQQDIQKAVDRALDQSFRVIPGRLGEDRHALGRRVQTQDSERVQYEGSDVVVIAFEGTGSYHPRKAQIIQDAAESLRDQGLQVDGSSGSLSSTVSKALDKVEGKSSGWSGLSAGPLEQLLRNPDLSARTLWLSFPSEEVEALSSMESFGQSRPTEILRDALESYRGETPGIENALRALREIREQALEQGKNPQFLLVSHSSGGRSLVKFLEKAKSITDEDGRPMTFPSAFTIDPVREAHEAVLEGGRELLNKGTEHNLNWVKEKLGLSPKVVYPPLVRHRSQPESLYKPSNLETLVNFYQLQDTEGLKMRPLVGIQGSPVAGAQNLEITDVGSGGHGEIAIHQEVRDAFMRQVEILLEQSVSQKPAPRIE